MYSLKFIFSRVQFSLQCKSCRAENSLTENSLHPAPHWPSRVCQTLSPRSLILLILHCPLCLFVVVSCSVLSPNFLWGFARLRLDVSLKTIQLSPPYNYYMDPWILLSGASLCPEDDSLWGITHYEITWLSSTVAKKQQNWHGGLVILIFEMVLHLQFKLAHANIWACWTLLKAKNKLESTVFKSNFPLLGTIFSGSFCLNKLWTVITSKQLKFLT